MTKAVSSPFSLRVADLAQRRPTRFEIIPDAARLETLRAELDLLELRKARLTGSLAPLGKTDWQLRATLGATVVQACVVSLAPVTTRLETEVSRQFVADYEMPQTPEAEMPEDDSTEPLGAVIDLWAVFCEALALALPLYPRAADVPGTPIEISAEPPGAAPLTDADTKPFAGLAALKSKLEGESDPS